MWHHVPLIGKLCVFVYVCVYETQRELKSRMVNEEAVTLLISRAEVFRLKVTDNVVSDYVIEKKVEKDIIRWLTLRVH